jgi:hypothetical protein
MYQPAMKALMDYLERQKAEIMARMAEAPADVPDIHPNIAEIYKAKVVRLTEALADPELHSEAADAIRSLVGEVVLTPGEKRGEMQAVLRGELMGILDFVSERWSHPSPEVITKGVAGPRNHQERTVASTRGGGTVILDEAQDPRQCAGQRDRAAAALLARMDVDALDQGADDFHRLRACLVRLQQTRKLRNLLPIEVREVRVDLDDAVPWGAA